MTVLRKFASTFLTVLVLTLAGAAVSHAQQAQPIPANAVRHPWTGICTLLPASNGHYASCVVRVPANEEVVIQAITLNISTSAPSHLVTQVSPTIGGTASYWLSMQTPVTINGTDYYNLTSSTTLYADPGSAVSVVVTDPSTSIHTLGGIGLVFIGYYVVQAPPVPAAKAKSNS